MGKDTLDDLGIDRKAGMIMDIKVIGWGGHLLDSA
jgi:hypothetical protein